MSYAPAVGCWFAPCCVLDLRKIETEDDLRSALEFQAEAFGRFWPTLEDALAALQSDEWDEDERAAAAKLIAEQSGGGA